MKHIKSFAALAAAALILFLLAGCGKKPGFKERREIIAAYNGTLDIYTEQHEVTPFDPHYALYDIDKDSVPELVFKAGGCEANYKYIIYTFRDGKAVKAGDIPGGHSSLYAVKRENGMILHWGHMGAELAVKITLADGKISQETIMEEHVVDFAGGEEYVQYPDIIEFTHISDRAAIDLI